MYVLSIIALVDDDGGVHTNVDYRHKNSFKISHLVESAHKSRGIGFDFSIRVENIRQTHRMG